MMRVEHDDMLKALPRLAAEGVLFDSVVTDPPYHLSRIVKRFGAGNAAAAKVGATGAYARASKGFMGKEWDGGDIAFRPETWAAVMSVMKPGAHLIAFSGTRTYHRMVCAIEDAGFEIRDQYAWCYGSGFPKSHDVSKAIDRHNGDVREQIPVDIDAPSYQRGVGNTRPWMDNPEHTRDGPSAASAASAAWQGWGTAAKPAWEPICLARKPLIGTVAANVLEHGTGALNIDGCRVQWESEADAAAAAAAAAAFSHSRSAGRVKVSNSLGAESRGSKNTYDHTAIKGRWPANIIHDGSEEVLSAFGGGADNPARFFYSAKADETDRLGSNHPTVKPTDLMAWLVRLVTPPGDLVLDPFAGSGSTGMACLREGFDAVLIEREAEYVADIKRRISHVGGGGTPLFGDGPAPSPPTASGSENLRGLRGRKIGPVGLKR